MPNTLSTAEFLRQAAFLRLTDIQPRCRKVSMEHLLAWLNEKRGRRSALAGALNINPGALSQWVQVPADRAADVEAFTNIPRETCSVSRGRQHET